MKNITFIITLCTLVSATTVLPMKRLLDDESPAKETLESWCTKRLYEYRSPQKERSPFTMGSNFSSPIKMNLWGSPRKYSSQTEDYDMDCVLSTTPENTELEKNYGRPLSRSSFSVAYEKIMASSTTKALTDVEVNSESETDFWQPYSYYTEEAIALSLPTQTITNAENTKSESETATDTESETDIESETNFYQPYSASTDKTTLSAPPKTLIKFFCKTEGCNKAFTSQGYLDNHMQQRSHTNKKTLPQPPHAHIQPTYTYTCTTEGCNKLFVDPYQLTEHMNMHTYIQPSIQPTYTCTYTLNDELPNDKKSFACTFEECGKSFAQKSNLTSHMRTHTGEKPFACPFEGCNKSFTQFENVTSHMRTHTGEKPFACTVKGCNKSFAQKSNLTAHILKHTGEKSFACTVAGCDKSFTDQSNRNRHIKAHNKENPHKCTFEGCKQSFTSKGKLTQHKQTHINENSPTCTFICTLEGCNQSFINVADLNEHKQKHYEFNFFIPNNNVPTEPLTQQDPYVDNESNLAYK